MTLNEAITNAEQKVAANDSATAQIVTDQATVDQIQVKLDAAKAQKSVSDQAGAASSADLDAALDELSAAALARKSVKPVAAPPVVRNSLAGAFGDESSGIGKLLT